MYHDCLQTLIQKSADVQRIALCRVQPSMDETPALITAARRAQQA